MCGVQYQGLKMGLFDPCIGGLGLKWEQVNAYLVDLANKRDTAYKQHTTQMISVLDKTIGRAEFACLSIYNQERLSTILDTIRASGHTSPWEKVAQELAEGSFFTWSFTRSGTGHEFTVEDLFNEAPVCDVPRFDEAEDALAHWPQAVENYQRQQRVRLL